MNIQTILVPLDLGECSVDVTERAGVLANKLRAEIVLLYIAELPPGTDPASMIQPLATPARTVSTYLADQAAKGLERFAEGLRRDNQRVRCLVRHGSAAPAILRTVEEVGADLVMMGTHGRQGLKRVLLGSVAEEVLRHSEVPVMTIAWRPDRDCQPGMTAARALVEAESNG